MACLRVFIFAGGRASAYDLLCSLLYRQSVLDLEEDGHHPTRRTTIKRDMSVVGHVVESPPVLSLLDLDDEILRARMDLQGLRFVAFQRGFVSERPFKGFVIRSEHVFSQGSYNVELHYTLRKGGSVIAFVVWTSQSLLSGPSTCLISEDSRLNLRQGYRKVMMQFLKLTESMVERHYRKVPFITLGVALSTEHTEQDAIFEAFARSSGFEEPRGIFELYLKRSKNRVDFDNGQTELDEFLSSFVFVDHFE